VAKPTSEQLAALQAYAQWAGEGWKQRLSLDWMRAGSDWPEARERWHFLQQLRNDFGPSWLRGADTAAWTLRRIELAAKA
jgi:hypothetical protein